MPNGVNQCLLPKIYLFDSARSQINRYCWLFVCIYVKNIFSLSRFKWVKAKQKIIVARSTFLLFIQHKSTFDTNIMNRCNQCQQESYRDKRMTNVDFRRLRVFSTLRLEQQLINTTIVNNFWEFFSTSHVKTSQPTRRMENHFECERRTHDTCFDLENFSLAVIRFENAVFNR